MFESDCKKRLLVQRHRTANMIDRSGQSANQSGRLVADLHLAKIRCQDAFHQLRSKTPPGWLLDERPTDFLPQKSKHRRALLYAFIPGNFNTAVIAGERTILYCIGGQLVDRKSKRECLLCADDDVGAGDRKLASSG